MKAECDWKRSGLEAPTRLSVLSRSPAYYGKLKRFRFLNGTVLPPAFEAALERKLPDA